MADHAVGRPCSACGTLTTFSGSFHDPDLTGTCPYCRKADTIPNPRYTGAAPAAKLDIDHATADQLKARVEEIKAELAAIEHRLEECAATPIPTVPPGEHTTGVVTDPSLQERNEFDKKPLPDDINLQPPDAPSPSDFVEPKRDG